MTEEPSTVFSYFVPKRRTIHQPVYSTPTQDNNTPLSSLNHYPPTIPTTLIIPYSPLRSTHLNSRLYSPYPPVTYLKPGRGLEILLPLVQGRRMVSLLPLVHRKNKVVFSMWSREGWWKIFLLSPLKDHVSSLSFIFLLVIKY